jgi:hypothetical protein
MNKCNTELLERTIDLSVIEVNKNKNPKGPWMEKTAMLTTPKRSMLTSYFHLSKITI